MDLENSNIIFRCNTLNVNDIITNFYDSLIKIELTDIIGYANKIYLNSFKIEAWKEKKIIGLCACYMNDHITNIAYITHLAVSDSYKRLGIGSELIKKTEEFAKKKFFKYIRLEVYKNNLGAIIFYKKRGYLIVEDRNDKWLLEKKI